VRLLEDAQLPPALARWLTAQGHDAQHVFDVALTDAADAVVWGHAIQSSAVIVTKDEHFAVRAQLHSGGPPIVWIRYGNVRRAELLRRFAVVWPSIHEALARGESLVEIV
jgi:predicted nuclease of predicted toxin-antitoxin system